MSDREASILKTILPDIDALLNRDILDLNVVDSQTLQSQLLKVIIDMFRRQEHLTVVILEDLQWAKESLAVIRQLNQIVEDLPLLLIGSYRNDERPDLPEELPHMKALKLARLQKESIEELSVSILGEAVGRQDALVQLLDRETEGNVFFVVEVVRALAQEAGQLDQIETSALPEHIFAEGIDNIIKRRLSMVPERAIPALQIAAIAGRQVDLNVLGRIMATADLSIELRDWLSVCEQAAILRVQDDRWYFDHDKLREGLLGELPSTKQHALHCQIAETIEATYPDDPTQIFLIAHHWGKGQNPIKEAHYAMRAGKQGLVTGANQQAIQFLERAIALAEHVNADLDEQVSLEQQLAEAYWNVDRPQESRQHIERALALLGRSPSNTAGLPILSELEHHLCHLLHIRKANDSSQNTDHLAEMDWPKLEQRIRAIADNHEESSNKLIAKYGRFSARLKQRSFLNTRADEAKEDEKTLLEKSRIALVSGIYAAGNAQWREVYEGLHQTTTIAERVGRDEWIDEAIGLLASALHYQGQWKASALLYEHLRSRALEKSQLYSLALLEQARNALYLGQLDEALSVLQQGDSKHIHPEQPLFKISHLSLLIDTHSRHNELDLARPYATQITTLLEALPPSTSLSLLEAYCSIAAFYLTLWEAEPKSEHRSLAKSALNNLHKQAQVLDIGRSRAWIYQGWYDWLNGKTEMALDAFSDGVSDAQELDTPYDEGLAHYHCGRMLPTADSKRNANLDRAVTIFEQLGATWDLSRAKDARVPANE